MHRNAVPTGDAVPTGMQCPQRSEVSDPLGVGGCEIVVVKCMTWVLATQRGSLARRA